MRKRFGGVIGASWSPAFKTVTVVCALILLTTAACSPLNAAEPKSAPVPATVEEATAAWYAGDLDRAIRGFRHLTTAEPYNAAHMLSLLVLLRESGRVDEAVALVESAAFADRSEVALTHLLAGAARPPQAASPQAVSPHAPSPEAPSSAASEPPQDSVDTRTSTVEARRLFFNATAHYLAGTSEAADALYDAALKTTPHFPYAHLYKGLIATERAEWDAALRSFTTARRQDSALTEAFEPQARALYALGRHVEALALLERAIIAVPWRTALVDLREQWRTQHPEAVASAAPATARRIADARAPDVEVYLAERAAEPTVRVGLAESLHAVHLKTGGNFSLVRVPSDLVTRSNAEQRAAVEAALSAEPVYRGGSNEILRVVFEAGLMIVERGAAPGDVYDPLAAAGTPLQIVYDDPRHTTIIFDLAYGHGQFNAGREDRAYRGAIELWLPPDDPAGFNVINVLPVEEYLYSVVPSEMPAFWPRAALEAQAVAARSYTLHPRTRFHNRGYALQSSVLSAYYRGVTGEHPATTAAVNATAGTLLFDGNRILDAVYSANSGGYTESSASVWGSVTALVGVSDLLLPPLDGQRSPAELYEWLREPPHSYSGAAPYAAPSAYRWQLVVPHQEIARRLEAAGQGVGRVVAIHPMQRGLSGRVERVRVRGTTGETVVQRDFIRSRLGGLRSNLFVVAPRHDAQSAVTHFVFEGAGWGHGVGLCQTGAAGMAAAGFDAAAILAHYYPRATLVDKNNSGL